MNVLNIYKHTHTHTYLAAMPASEGFFDKILQLQIKYIQMQK